jgi:O-antigen/teichoic acid export membrane protein
VAGKAKRLVRGSMLGGTSFVLRMVISLFMTPFMIACFGDHTYGLWMLVASFSGFYGILDLGLSTAVQRYMARSVGSGDTEEANGVFNTSLGVFCGIGFLAMIFAGAIAWMSPVFVKTAADIPIFRLIIILCSVNIVIGFPMRSFWGVLSSNLRYDISIYLEIINVVAKAVLIVAFLKWGFGVVAVAAINLIVDMVWNAANVVYALKVAPYIRISIKYFEWAKIKVFLGYSVYVLISRIADNIRFNIDNYVISAFVGLSAVTVYSVGIRLVRYAGDLLGKLIGLMTPVFSQYEGQGDFDSIREKFLFMFKVSIYISIFFGGLLVMVSRPFIERWVGPGYEESSRIILILVIPTVFGMMMSPSNQVLYGISKHKFLTWVNSIEAVVNLILSLIFVRFWGIQGVALGTAIPMVITKTLIQPVYIAKVLSLSVIHVYRVMLSAMTKSLLVFTVLYVLTRGIIAVSFLRIVIFGAFQTVLYAAVLFYIGFTVSERSQLFNSFVPERVKKYFKEDKKNDQN